jgi:hypothetical protein
MKKLLCVTIAAAAIALLLAACPMVDEEDSGPKWTDNVTWVDFPDDAIQYGVCYAGDGVTDAGTITKNSDGTWDITIKYTQGNQKSQIAIGGEALTFKRNFWVTAEFPEEAPVKPQKFMVMQSPSLPADNDPQSGADWGNAWQSQLQDFGPIGPIKGEITASNLDTDGNNVATNVEEHTLVLWLYFDTILSSGTYTFKLKEVKAGNLAYGGPPPVLKASAGIAGATNAYSRVITQPSIARNHYRVENSFTAETGSTGLAIDIKLPDDAADKTYTFDIAATAFAGNTTNLLLTTDVWNAAYIAAGTTEPQQNTVSAPYEAATNPAKAGYVKITGKAAAHDDLFGETGVGLKLIIPFASTVSATRYVAVLYFPEGYVE